MRHLRRLGVPRRISYRTLIGGTAVLAAVAAVGLALSPVAAQAGTSLSATGQAFGATSGAAMANAEASAYSNLSTLAQSDGYVCTGITYTTSLYYVVPSGGGDVYNATATGNCGPPPPPSPPGPTLSATGQAWGATSGAAIANAEASAYGNLYTLAQGRGETCTGITYTASLYYVVPGGGGDVYNATATGTC